VNASIKLYEKEMRVLLSLPESNMAEIVKSLLLSALGEDMPKLDVMSNGIFELINSQAERAKELSKKQSGGGKKGMSNRWDNGSAVTSDQSVASSEEEIISSGDEVISSYEGVISSYNSEITPDNTLPVHNDNITNTEHDITFTTSSTSSELNQRENATEEAAEAILNLYSEMCPKLLKPYSLTDNRKKAIVILLKQMSVEDIKRGFKAINKSSYCCGKSGWKADFDFCIRADSIVKALEGKYDDSAHIGENADDKRNLKGGAPRASPKKKTGFSNFEERKIDFNEIQKLEMERIDREMAQEEEF
jgi:hypothetical protein